LTAGTSGGVAKQIKSLAGFWRASVTSKNYPG